MAVSGGGIGPDRAFDLLAGDVHHLRSLFEAAHSEDDIETLLAEAESIIAMPAEEKFTGGANLYASLIDVDGDFSEIDAEDLPQWVKRLFGQDNASELAKQLLAVGADELQRIREELYEEILERPQRPNSYLILSMLLCEYEDLLRYMIATIHDEEPEPDKQALASIYSVLGSHLLLITHKERQRIYPELIRDLYRSPSYFALARGQEANIKTEEVSPAEMKQVVLLRSVLMLYNDQEISVSRGAELLDIDRQRFEELLAEQGLRPNYGPTTAEAFDDDVELVK